MIVMASHMQEQEVGDGTNFVLVFAGALLEQAEELLRMGLSVSEVIYTRIVLQHRKRKPVSLDLSIHIVYMTEIDSHTHWFIILF